MVMSNQGNVLKAKDMAVPSHYTDCEMKRNENSRWDFRSDIAVAYRYQVHLHIHSNIFVNI